MRPGFFSGFGLVKLVFVYFVAFIVAFDFALSGCSGLNTNQTRSPNLSRQDQNLSSKRAPQNLWLERNYPSRAAYFDNLPTKQSYFREDVLAGLIQLGMRVDEVLIATGTEPYGPKSYKGKFWCDNHAVAQCNTACNHCDGILFVAGRLVVFSGNSQLPTAINIDDYSASGSIFTNSTHSTKHRIAEALYRNEVTAGMSLAQVRRVLIESNTATTYYCNNYPLPAKAACTPSCSTCTIETRHAQGPSEFPKTIYLEIRDGELQVTRFGSMGINQ